jgi:transcriptional regulator with XRE-family HTH domain
VSSAPRKALEIVGSLQPKVFLIFKRASVVISISFTILKYFYYIYAHFWVLNFAQRYGIFFHYPNKKWNILKINFISMSIALRIKELRQSKKLSGKKFAEAINIDNSQYSKIENGKLVPTIEHLMEIYSNFNVSIDWLLMGEGKTFRDQEIAMPSNSESFFYKEIKELNREIGALNNENKRLRAENDDLKQQLRDAVSARKRTVNLDEDNNLPDKLIKQK